MAIRYKNHDVYPDNIFIRDFEGEVNVHEIINSWNYLLDNQMITPDLKGIINNLTSCKLNMNLDSFNTLVNFLKMNESLRSIKLAVICDNPATIVFPMIGETRERDLRIRPFSTETAAVNWILKEG